MARAEIPTDDPKVTDPASTYEEVGFEDPELAKKESDSQLKRESCQKWVLLIIATALVMTTIILILYFGINNPGPTLPEREEDRGRLPATCTLLHDTALSTVDPTKYFEESTLLNDVAPPQRTGSLRDAGALPTGHFACNQINHGPLKPIRQFPHSALMTKEGITYEAYTLDRWNQTARQDPFYQLTPGKNGAPWEKIVSMGTNLKQMVSGPDGAPLAAFTGSSGIRIGIKDAGEPMLTDFGEMYANFLYTDTEGGTMELPIVRGSAMLTHLFTQANPVVSPLCLVAVNGQDVGFGCPEERSVADRGTGYVRATCSRPNQTMEIALQVHFTKAITEVADVQWAATEEGRWASDRAMHTCDSTTCDMDDTGHNVNITVPANGEGMMFYAVNVIDYYVMPGHGYGNEYWVNIPGRVHCSDAGSGLFEASGTRQPVWFYGSAGVSGQCDGSRRVDITVSLSHPAGGLEEIQYIVARTNLWDGSLPWLTCLTSSCTLSAGGTTVTISVLVTYDDVSYAVNVISQYVTEAVPFNWRRQPEMIRCDGQPVNPTAGQTVEITGKSFDFELSEPRRQTGPSPGGTRKFVAYFSEEMKLTFPVDGSPGVFSPTGDGTEKFTGVMQLVYAGSGPKGDLSTARNLDQYAGVYSYKPKTRFCTEDDKGYISFDWNKQGGDFFGQNPKENILTVVLPHQESLLPKENLVDTPFVFKGHVGDVWVMEEDLPRASMEPDPEAIQRIKDDPDKLKDIKEAMDKDAAHQQLFIDCSKSSEPQSYWAGKSIGMVARLASISRALGTDHYTELEKPLRKCLDMWLGLKCGLSEVNSFRYDTVWGGLFIRSADPGQPVYPYTNFGFVSYADHHFHLGYWMYAIAYYATYHKDWAMEEENYDRIMTLARDVGNPSKADGFFPTVRQKDWYLGSSWATGIGGEARQEESSSEAINGYHALAALGEALGHSALRAIGQLTLATEIRATRHYWHVRPYNQHLFPPLIREYGVIGQLQEDGIFYYMLNWACAPDQFPQTHACIVGIQLLPITAVSHLYMDKEWALNVQDICRWAIDPTTAPGATTLDPRYNLDPVSTNWSSFCYALISKCDPETQAEAAEYIKSLETSQLEPGTGLASTLLFIYESA
ncbi:uncharacterized protein LOC119729546 [Patiria miniata]|uniref:glucan endo-1,3-beta-D-glucosidase n=1 Tax=Patiria miniata TaxID=46514 RepID=A0A914A339_PATMI|nr:uncharacterized protein LOC119729546 [Patiria miniata]